MLLQPEDAALFYRAWGALLTWVNGQRRIVPRFPLPTPNHPIDASLANQIKKVVWAEDLLREQFLAEGAADLGSEERDLIASWKHRVCGSFVVFKHLEKHSIFMSKDVYGVLGLYTPFDVLVPDVPMFVEAVLIPFRDVIITDGIISSPGVQISFGAGARRGFNNQYRTAREASEIRTALPWRADPEPRSISTLPKPSRKRGASRSGRSVPLQARSIRLVEGLREEDESLPGRPPGDITEALDPEVAPLVESLRSDRRLVTKGSCCGHGKAPAYVDLAVEGVEGLRVFVERLNRVDRKVAREAVLDVTLNWSTEVVTSCAFDIFPNWIMLSLRVEGAGRKGAPSAALLKKIARLYRDSTA